MGGRELPTMWASFGEEKKCQIKRLRAGKLERTVLSCSNLRVSMKRM